MKIAAPAIALAAASLLAACSAPLPVASNTTAVEVNGTEEVMPSEGDAAAESERTNATDVSEATAETQSRYLGRWVGVEGMSLDVADKPLGGVTLAMQWDLDHSGSFDGSITPAGLRFTRNGVAETAVRTDGKATGLKYLAGKKDCLTVKPGEGYCRD